MLEPILSDYEVDRDSHAEPKCLQSTRPVVQSPSVQSPNVQASRVQASMRSESKRPDHASRV